MSFFMMGGIICFIVGLEVSSPIPPSRRRPPRRRRRRGDRVCVCLLLSYNLSQSLLDLRYLVHMLRVFFEQALQLSLRGY